MLLKAAEDHPSISLGLLGDEQTALLEQYRQATASIPQWLVQLRGERFCERSLFR